MLFWIVAIVLALAVAALLGRAVLHAGQGLTAPAESFDMQVYRDQLGEVERDLSRGVIAQAEAGRVRTEISRRLLAADAAVRRAGARGHKAGPGRIPAVIGAALVMASALGLYVWLGAPGYPDLPRAGRIAMAKAALDSRPTQDEAEQRMDGPVSMPGLDASDDFKDLMAKLRTAVAARPDDIRGFRLLSRNEATLGNFKPAYQAQGRVIALAGGSASGQDYADYADLMILSAGGLISAEASDALQNALKRDPANGTATYYTGLLMAQTGRPDIAFRLWDGLLRRSSDNDPWTQPIRGQIDQIAQLAGQTRYQQPTPPETLSGPSADDIAAARDMTPDQRQEMIRGMVNSLSERLASQGGSVQEWTRLIGALGVLGETDRARAIYRESTQVFTGQDDALTQLQDAAKSAGVAE